MPRKNPRYDETVAVAETYSHSEDDEEYDDDSVVEEEEEVPFWRQHLPAIMIAFVAAMAGHLWNQSQQQSTLLKTPEFSTLQHPHVQDYRRTANISFCPNEKIVHGGNEFLKSMDFFVPTEFHDTIVKYYQADIVEDDLYEQLRYSKLPANNRNIDCLKSQKGLKYKGTSFYYQVRMKYALVC